MVNTLAETLLLEVMVNDEQCGSDECSCVFRAHAVSRMSQLLPDAEV